MGSLVKLDQSLRTEAQWPFVFKIICCTVLSWFIWKSRSSLEKIIWWYLLVAKWKVRLKPGNKRVLVLNKSIQDRLLLRRFDRITTRYFSDHKNTLLVELSFEPCTMTAHQEFAVFVSFPILSSLWAVIVLQYETLRNSLTVLLKVESPSSTQEMESFLGTRELAPHDVDINLAFLKCDGRAIVLQT